MATTKKWGVSVLGLTVIGLIGFFVLTQPNSRHDQTYAQDATLVSAATDLHPTQVFSVVHKADSLQEAFQAAGVSYFPEDKVSFFPDPILGLGTVITVQRALVITVVDGKKTKTLRTWATTVGGLLKDKKIELGDDDKIAPTLTTPLAQNTIITINRVARTQVSELETINFPTVQKNDDTMWRGESILVQEGKNGQREKKYLLIREDGELVSKTLLSNNVIVAAVNKILRVGTKLKIGRTLTGKSTWYQCCGTKVAMDAFRKGTTVRVTNLNNGKSIIVGVDGCICGTSGVLIDLAPDYFQQLGGLLNQGVLPNVRVEEVLN